MQVLDWIIIIIIAVGTVLGFTKGFLRQLAEIIGLIAGLLVARTLYSAVGERLAAELGTSVTFAQILAFALIWLIIPVGFLWMASVLTRAIEAIHLGFVNRWFGALLGGAKYGLLVCLAIYFVEFADSKNDLIGSTTKQASLLYYPMESFSSIFIPAIKDVTKQLIDTDICSKNPINM